jgi:DNA-binding cell septation regulator SpoVG
MTVEILDVKPLPNAGTLKALVSIRLGEVVIHGCKVVRQDGQRLWCALPSREYTGKDGERRFTPVVELPDTLKKEVSQRVLSAWERQEGRLTTVATFDDTGIPDPGEPTRRRQSSAF